MSGLSYRLIGLVSFQIYTMYYTDIVDGMNNKDVAWTICSTIKKTGPIPYVDITSIDVRVTSNDDIIISV